MPVHPVTKHGRIIGYQWGHHGKIYLLSKYTVAKAKELASKQGRAAFANGWKGK